MVLCSHGRDWQSDRKWWVSAKGRAVVRSHKTISTPLSLNAFVEAEVSEDRMRRENNDLRDLLRSVNDWVPSAAAGKTQ